MITPIRVYIQVGGSKVEVLSRLNADATDTRKLTEVDRLCRKAKKMIEAAS